MVSFTTECLALSKTKYLSREEGAFVAVIYRKVQLYVELDMKYIGYLVPAFN